MAAPRYRLEFFVDEAGDEPVLRWLRALPPPKRRAIGVAMFEILQHEGPNVVGTNFGRSLGGGLFEFKLDQDAIQILRRKGKRALRPDEPSRVLLRVFCHAHGDQIVLLLGGYDKGEHPSPRISKDRSLWPGNGSGSGRLEAWHGEASVAHLLDVDIIGYTQYRSFEVRGIMSTKFSDFMRELAREAKAEGPDAAAELRYFRARFRLARRLMEARRKKGWTQNRLAQKAGLRQSEVSGLESGNSNPTFRTLHTVASALGAKLELHF